MKHILITYSVAMLLVVTTFSNSAYADRQSAATMSPVIMLLLNDDSGEVRSVTLSLNFTSPTTREDDSPLALNEIASYSLRYRIVGTTAYQTASIASQMSLYPFFTKTVEADLGNYEFSIATVDINGRKGNYSSSVLVDLN